MGFREYLRREYGDSLTESCFVSGTTKRNTDTTKHTACTWGGTTMLYVLRRWLKEKQRHEVIVIRWDVHATKPVEANYRCPVCERNVVQTWYYNYGFNCPRCKAKLFYGQIR